MGGTRRVAAGHLASPPGQGSFPQIPPARPKPLLSNPRPGRPHCAPRLGSRHPSSCSPHSAWWPAPSRASCGVLFIQFRTRRRNSKASGTQGPGPVEWTGTQSPLGPYHLRVVAGAGGGDAFPLIGLNLQGLHTRHPHATSPRDGIGLSPQLPHFARMRQLKGFAHLLFNLPLRPNSCHRLLKSTPGLLTVLTLESSGWRAQWHWGKPPGREALAPVGADGEMQKVQIESVQIEKSTF